MGRIKIDVEKYITVSLRLKNSFVNDLDQVVKNLSELLGEEIGRNVILEPMLLDSKENAKFEVGDKLYSFNQLLYKEDGVITKEYRKSSSNLLTNIETIIENATNGFLDQDIAKDDISTIIDEYFHSISKEKKLASLPGDTSAEEPNK